MFSGIVEEAAEVVSISRNDPARLVIRSRLDHSKSMIGDSIAIDGVCLTLVEKSGQNLSFDVLNETLRRSSLGSLASGMRVNLERSLEVGSRLHGHFVFGHVDATIELIRREPDGNCDRLTWSLPDGYGMFLVSKGSVSISGISLTVGEVTRDTFSVYIIPHTAEITILSGMKPGMRANLEVDMLARYVHSIMSGSGAEKPAAQSRPISLDFLRSHGFAKDEA